MSRIIRLENRGGFIEAIGAWLIRIGLVGIFSLAGLTATGMLPADTVLWPVAIALVVVGYCMYWRTTDIH